MYPLKASAALLLFLHVVAESTLIDYSVTVSASSSIIDITLTLSSQLALIGDQQFIIPRAVQADTGLNLTICSFSMSPRSQPMESN